ncbi:MAG: hypothetical protein IMZ44_04705, partial [Planctomycetes bacterium]|nr:hypothetical protein [Planctomycetota bacterium]
RVRIRAANAGIESISAENGQLLLQTTAEDEGDTGRRLGADVRRSRRGYWLARREGWRQRLLEVLDLLRA